ncbi:MAG: hypothetical protein IT582_11025 [Opitutaceae bacterium]|nr:hypothetical protein [Opitutaceae bacterium]
MKRFFAQRNRRERWLILTFGLFAAAWWITALVGRGRDFYREWQSLRTDAATQALWLQNRDGIMARVDTAGRALDPSKALDSAQSFATLNTMLSGLDAELGSQRTDRTDQFALHSMQVNIRRADLAALLDFYENLAARAPYLGIDQCTLATDRANPGKLSASFRIYSVEVVSAK